MDKYRTFRALALHERENEDYAITVVRRPSPILVMAPHGGGIEPGASELARAIAGEDYSLYLFEGLKTAGNEDLHITSTHFDEPHCFEVVHQAHMVLAIHGARGSRPVVHLGGLAESLVARLQDELSAAGFAARRTKNLAIAGNRPGNICNRSASGQGCQLELSRDLRCTMFENLDLRGRRRPTPPFDHFVAAVRTALQGWQDQSQIGSHV